MAVSLRLQGQLLGATSPLDPHSDGVTSAWTFVSGPATPTIDNPAVLNPLVTFPAIGSYVLRLTITSSAFNVPFSGSNDVTIEVDPPFACVAPPSTPWAGYFVGADSPFYIGSVIPPGPFPAQGTQLDVPENQYGPGTFRALPFTADQLGVIYQRPTRWTLTSNVHLHGDDGAGGTFDSDGTDSLFIDVPKIVSCPPDSRSASGSNGLSMTLFTSNANWALSGGGFVWPRIQIDCVCSSFSVSNYGRPVFTKSWDAGPRGGGFLTCPTTGTTSPLTYDDVGGFDPVDGQNGDRGIWTQTKTGGMILTIE